MRTAMSDNIHLTQGNNNNVSYSARQCILSSLLVSIHPVNSVSYYARQKKLYDHIHDLLVVALGA
jgi:hypothetical protein